MDSTCCNHFYRVTKNSCDENTCTDTSQQNTSSKVHSKGKFSGIFSTRILWIPFMTKNVFGVEWNRVSQWKEISGILVAWYIGSFHQRTLWSMLPCTEAIFGFIWQGMAKCGKSCTWKIKMNWITFSIHDFYRICALQIYCSHKCKNYKL